MKRHSHRLLLIRDTWNPRNPWERAGWRSFRGEEANGCAIYEDTE